MAELATPSALTDRGTERQGDRQAHVQAMPGEAARAELPLPEAGGPGSRTGETAADLLSGPIPFSLSIPQPPNSPLPCLSRPVLPSTLHPSPTPHPQDFMKAWRPQTASSKPEAMKGSVLAFHSGWRWGSLFFGPILIYLGLCAASRFFCSRRAAGFQDRRWGGRFGSRRPRGSLQAHPLTTRGSLEVP